MTVALFMLAGGVLMVTSGWRGKSIAETLRGDLGTRSNTATQFARIFDVAAFRERASVPAVSSGGARSATRPANYKGGTGNVSTAGGAIAIVESAVRVAASVANTHVVSAYRPGDPKDHGSNDAHRAARDIGVPGVDAITGPWNDQHAAALVAVGHAFGRNYGTGHKRVVDTFTWHGFRIQIIGATPEYGGHRGHIHIGVLEL